ncbi:MAG: HEAT repeat domain-containing protein [Cellvibrio sp.]
MNKIIVFILGCGVGIAGTLYVVPNSSNDTEVIATSENNDNSTAEFLNTEKPRQPVTFNDSKPTSAPSQLQSPLDIESKLNAFTADTEHLFERKDYKDLAYLIRNDKKVAAAVRNKLLNSTSYEEKYALVNLLAQDSSSETVELVIDMIKKPDDESKRLGYELLRSMDIKENQPELNTALLDSTYYETNPELLTDVIYRLSEKKLDDSTKTVAIDRFQSLLSNNNNAIKARAIDGLSQLGNQDTISSTVKRYIQDTDESVRVSAISAAFKLNPSHLDDEIVGTLTRITKNPAEPESVRNMASAVLDSRKSL